MKPKGCINIGTRSRQRVIVAPSRKVSNDGSWHLEQYHTWLTHRTFLQINVALRGSTVQQLGCPASKAAALINKIEAINVELPG